MRTRAMPKALSVLLDSCSGDELVELEHALRLTLNPQPTPAMRRVAELGALASILNTLKPDVGFDFPTVTREFYDATRPSGAPSSSTLVKRHGAWITVCGRAYGLQPDGTWTGRRHPWAAVRGPRPHPYSHGESRAALQLCHESLNRYPAITVYAPWRLAELERARLQGRDLRLPSERAIYRLYPSEVGGWPAAVTDAIGAAQ